MQAKEKSAIQNSIWREKLDIIADMLSAIHRRLKIAEAEQAYIKYGLGQDVFYCFSDREFGEWFNITREKTLKILSLFVGRLDCVNYIFLAECINGKREERWG